MKALIGFLVRQVSTNRIGVILDGGWIGISSTFVRFADGTVEEITDGELVVLNQKG